MALRNSTTPPSGGGYRVELSIDPGFLQVPVSPAFALIPSRLTTRSKAFLCGRRCALSIRPTGGTFYPLSLATRSPSHFLLGAVSWSPNFSIPYCPLSIGHHFAIGRDVRLGRRGELHPPAPSVAAPALLEACGFSVCSVEDWRSSTCRVGNPARPVGQCVFAVAVCPERPRRRALGADRRSLRLLRRSSLSQVKGAELPIPSLV